MQRLHYMVTIESVATGKKGVAIAELDATQGHGLDVLHRALELALLRMIDAANKPVEPPKEQDQPRTKRPYVKRNLN